MKKIIWIFVFSFLLSCTKGDIVLKVGRHKLTKDEFQEKILSVPVYYQGFLATSGGRRQYLEGIMKEYILVELARRRGLRKRKDVKKRIQEEIDRILLETIIDDLKEKELNVTEKEIKDYYERNKEQYLHPLKVRASHILVDTREKAEEVLKRLKEGESFTKLVKEYSLDSLTVDKAGDLGYFSKGEMVPEFEKAVFSLKELGDTTGIIETPFGYHIAKLTGRKKAESKTIEEAHEEIKKILVQEKLDKLIDFYKKKFHVKINYKIIDQMKAPWEMNKEKNKKEGEKSSK